MKPTTIRTFCATIFALFAFAGNSVLCRLALGDGQIDATSFTIVRLLSGALGFVALLWLSKAFSLGKNTSLEVPTFGRGLHLWSAPGLLFIYAAGFSFAYIALDTGVGALVLFGTVQLTMVGVSIYRRECLPWYHLSGMFIAFSGLCYLIYSQLGPAGKGLSLFGFMFMVVAGLAWAGYTLQGRGSKSPLSDTRRNFMLSTCFCAPLLAVYLIMPAALSSHGFWLAVSSGVVTSALGYTVWYIALPNLSRVQAGVVQLLVPIIAAVGGVIWVGEDISGALIVAQTMVLGGIGLVMIKPKGINT